MNNPLVKLAKNFASKTPEKKLLLLGGLAYTPAAILIPIVTHFQLKKQPQVSNRDRKLLLGMAVIRQAVGAVMHYVGYYGAIAISGKLLKMEKKTLPQFGIAVLATTALEGVLKPLLSNSALIKWFYKPDEVKRAESLQRVLKQSKAIANPPQFAITQPWQLPSKPAYGQWRLPSAYPVTYTQFSAAPVVGKI